MEVDTAVPLMTTYPHLLIASHRGDSPNPNFIDPWPEEKQAEEIPSETNGTGSLITVSSSSTTTTTSKSARGLFLVLTASICFSCSNFCVYLLSTLPEPKIPSVQTSFVRFTFQFSLTALSILVARYKDVNKRQTWMGKPGNAWKLFWRGAWGVCGLSGWFLSLSIMTLSDATAIVFTNVSLTGLLAHWILGEVFLLTDAIAALVGLLGVVFIAQPSALFGASGADRPLSPISVLIGLAAAGCSAMAYVSARLIGPGEDFLVTTLWFASLGVICTPFMVLVVAGGFVPSSTPAATNLQVAAGFLGWIGQLFLNSGLAQAPSGPASVMRYAELIIALFVQSVFLNDTPNGFKWVGSFLILSSVVSTLYRQRMLKAQKETAGKRTLPLVVVNAGDEAKS